MRDSRPAYMKLENPSLGARKESILTDEMMIAFCESRLDWIAKDMEELFTDLREFASSMELDFQEQAAAEFNTRESSLDYVELQLPYTLAVYSYREEFEFKYDNLRLYLNDRIKTNSWGKSSYAIEIPFVDPWYEGSHSLDVMAMLLNYNSEVDLNGFASWVALHDWAWANIDFFKFAISYAVHQEPKYRVKMDYAEERYKRNKEERNRLCWKKELAEARVKQSRALNIIEHGYKGETLQLFRKKDVPVKITELEVVRITPSMKSVDVRFVGRDFSSYSYHHIWRSGTNYTERKEWVAKGVRISTLLETSVVDDFSEEASPYDSSHTYYRLPVKRRW